MSSSKTSRRGNKKQRPYSNKKGGPLKTADNRTKWIEDQKLTEEKL